MGSGDGSCVARWREFASIGPLGLWGFVEAGVSGLEVWVWWFLVWGRRFRLEFTVYGFRVQGSAV